MSLRKSNMRVKVCQNKLTATGTLVVPDAVQPLTNETGEMHCYHNSQAADIPIVKAECMSSASRSKADSESLRYGTSRRCGASH